VRFETVEHLRSINLERAYSHSATVAMFAFATSFPLHSRSLPAGVAAVVLPSVGVTRTVVASPARRAIVSMTAETDPETEARTESIGAKSGAARQLLGIKGGTETDEKWKLQLQLMKPVTWIPLIWGVACGAAASGNYTWNDPADIAKGAACMFLAGPLLTGYTQVWNDVCDVEMDRISEPNRPIASGRVTEREANVQASLLVGLGFVLSAVLDVWAGHKWPVNVALTTFGVFVAYIYSAPPLKLKKNGWVGAYALGASYIALPWWAGQALFGELDWKTMVLTCFYSLAGLGIALINDFKSIEGDRKMGINSIPVAFGVEAAKWITVGTIDGFQLLAAAVLYAVGERGYAAAIVALVLPQLYFQFTLFLKDPVANDVKYQAAAQPFLVLGILVAGIARGHHGPL
jgi:chlorophyll/bacteriochlorophyll a synthase